MASDSIDVNSMADHVLIACHEPTYPILPTDRVTKAGEGYPE